MSHQTDLSTAIETIGNLVQDKIELKEAIEELIEALEYVKRQIERNRIEDYFEEQYFNEALTKAKKL